MVYPGGLEDLGLLVAYSTAYRYHRLCNPFTGSMFRSHMSSEFPNVAAVYKHSSGTTMMERISCLILVDGCR